MNARFKILAACALAALPCLTACATVDDSPNTSSAAQNECRPSCTFRECGDDGCGGSCGTCHFGEQCTSAGQCECVPSCSGRECGDDGCGGSCGTCASGETCELGTCVCVPYCGSARCGGDGCGGSCGECGDWEYCGSGGHCIERPPPPPPACTHSLCEPGVALRSECDGCVARVCRSKPGCCSVRWDASCVAAAAATCGGHC